MRIIVAGTRTFSDYVLMERKLDKILSPLDKVTILTGDAQGADALVKRYCFSRFFTCEVYHAEWEKHGNAAGPLRNEQMASANAQALIAFWNGKSKGTLDMIERSKKHKLKIRIVRY